MPTLFKLKLSAQYLIIKLYDLLLNEFSTWLKEATKKGILNKQIKPVKQVQPDVLNFWQKLKKIFSSSN